jgi:hypothetical protein
VLRDGMIVSDEINPDAQGADWQTPDGPAVGR